MAKTLTGVVSSNAPDKTIVIKVHTRKTHPIYKKQYTVTSKYMAHDEKNECQVGDKVIIVETKPLSARKRFILQTVIEKAVLSEKEREVISGDETAKKKAEEKAEAAKKIKEEVDA